MTMLCSVCSGSLSCLCAGNKVNSFFYFYIRTQRCPREQVWSYQVAKEFLGLEEIEPNPLDGSELHGGLWNELKSTASDW